MIVVKHVDSIVGSLLPIRLSTFKLVTFIRLLKRSYFCLFLLKGLIKVLFLGLNENFNSLNGLRSIRGNIIVNTN